MQFRIMNSTELYTLEVICFDFYFSVPRQNLNDTLFWGGGFKGLDVRMLMQTL